MFEFEMIDVTPNDIRAIMEAYGIADFDIPDKQNPNFKIAASRRIASLVVWYANNGYSIDHATQTSFKDLPLLIQFLRTCEGSDIELRGKIQNPHGKQVKGTELKVTISNHHFLRCLELFANTWLEQQQNELYQDEFGWDSKEPLKVNDEEQDPYFTDPYTDEEINDIIDYYERLEKSYRKYTKKGELGRLAVRIVDIIEPVATDMKQIDCYSFVFDVMLKGGMTGEDSITYEGKGREKADQVRYWLNAYKKAIMKQP